ncbi:MAG: DUF2490 domain-containing protein [Pseudomonadota bacterium]|nr:DUF2490 domain-containing protein [Pseudomonadota bacterium]
MTIVYPAAAVASSDNQFWLTGNLAANLSGKIRLSQELTTRLSNNRNGLYEVESNTMLGYRMGKKVTLWLGYTHDPNYAAGSFTVLERRFRQQVSVDNALKIGGGTVSGRMRLEERWREGVPGPAWRLRPYAKFSLPLRDKLALVLTHETFIHLNTTAFQRGQGVGRMRNFAGVNVPLGSRIGAEVGYLNQYGFVRDGDDSVDHVAALTLSASFK